MEGPGIMRPAASAAAAGPTTREQSPTPRLGGLFADRRILEVSVDDVAPSAGSPPERCFRLLRVAEPNSPGGTSPLTAAPCETLWTRLVDPDMPLARRFAIAPVVHNTFDESKLPVRTIGSDAGGSLQTAGAAAYSMTMLCGWCATVIAVCSWHALTGAKTADLIHRRPRGMYLGVALTPTSTAGRVKSVLGCRSDWGRVEVVRAD